MSDVHYDLTLFVSGASDLSARAIAEARSFCDSHLAHRYELSVVDIHDNAGEAVGGGVLAAPTLVKNRPLPARKLVGDLSDAARVRQALDIPVAEDASGARR